MLTVRFSLLAALALSPSISIAQSSPFAAEEFKPERCSDAVPAGPFDKQLLDAAGEYIKWGRVDDEFRWAPWLCRSPEPGRVTFSQSDDQGTHGQKLYSLFAKNHDDYYKLTKGGKVAVGQAIVKQSWHVEEITDVKQQPAKRVEYEKIVRSPAPAADSKTPWIGDEKRDHFYPFVWRGDKVYKAARQADLFVMLKLDAKTPDTDGGWVYGTLTPDGKKVTSAGKVESCMKCHVEAKNERLFGLWRDLPEVKDAK